jgi:nicotinate-nucleotide--dimethylbenzimidazole phosphoribosyltransferase
MSISEISDRVGSVTVQQLQHRLDTRTKPQGSLGMLEKLAVRIGLILDSERPRFINPTALVFAADHGIAAEGVSAFPSEVTAQMVENYLASGAAINVLAKQHGLNLQVIDAGVACTVPARAGLCSLAVAPGTRNFLREPAMSNAQRDQAIAGGRSVVAGAIESGSNAIVLGEMGIANTASAALLLHRLLGWPVADCVGRGTGLDDGGVQRKAAVLQAASQRCPATLGALQMLSEFGGFEIAMLVGALLEIAEHPCLAVIDGFTVSVAALLASRINPQVLAHCLFSHRSAEHGHRALLAHLNVEPILDLQLRLGEGSGAALAWPIIDSAARLMSEMASFESAGVSNRDNA